MFVSGSAVSGVFTAKRGYEAYCTVAAEQDINPQL